MVTLQITQAFHLEHLFHFQTDPLAIQIAAFTPKDPYDKSAYLSKWEKLLLDPTITLRTIYLDQQIVGSVSKYMMEGEAQITYWLDRAFWGKGIGSNALQLFLNIEPVRPIFGRVAFDNIASQRVLERNQFKKIGQDKFFANARGTDITEFIYKLE